MNIDKDIKPGDRVEVHLTKLIYEGILLETPKAEKGIILLKLDSGYNIGFNRKDVSEVKLIKSLDKKEEKSELKSGSSSAYPKALNSGSSSAYPKALNSGSSSAYPKALNSGVGKPGIGMIITGGTIASRYDAKTGAVSWLTSPENLFKFYPEIFEKVNIVKVEVPFMKGSENMNPNDWKKIARVAKEMLNDSNIKGVIIAQGTDTLHYTSAVLSFFLRNLNKPVVLTFSQRSTDRASSDANLNLQCSALAAISDMAEVMIVGHASENDDFCYAMPGTKTRKLHTSRRDAFKVVNALPFAKVYPDKIIKLSDYNLKHTKKCQTDLNYEEKVALIKFYPGQSPDILDYYVKNKYKGIIIEMLGLGQVATTSESKLGWTKKIKEIQSKGIVVCAASQTIYGRLDPLVYSTGRELLDAGVIYLEDMLSECALVKLGWVLGHEDWANNKGVIKEKMLENISHEFGDRIK